MLSVPEEGVLQLLWSFPPAFYPMPLARCLAASQLDKGLDTKELKRSEMLGAATEITCRGAFLSICLPPRAGHLLLLFCHWPRTPLTGSHWLGSWESGLPHYASTVNVTPQTAIYYHSNEPATMEGEICRLISLARPFPSSP